MLQEEACQVACTCFPVRKPFQYDVGGRNVIRVHDCNWLKEIRFKSIKVHLTLVIQGLAKVKRVFLCCILAKDDFGWQAMPAGPFGL